MLLKVLRAVAVGGVLAALAVGIAVRQASGPEPIPTPLPTAWQYKTEQEWIVAEVVRALADMAYYAVHGKAADARQLEVTVETQVDAAGATAFDVRFPAEERTVRLKVGDYIWSPALYAPVAAELLGAAAVGGPPADPAAESETLRALTRPRTDVMVSESQRVSAALAARMTDVAAQEDAALLYAALGLREWSGQFYDNHGALCRLAAHLAMAASLRKDTAPGLSARIAEETLQTLAFRDQLGVLSRLDALAATKPPAATQAWIRTLRMRNTEDWRILATPETATLLERREHLIWVYSKLGDSLALEFLDRTHLDELPDWGSIILYGAYSVEAAGRFVPSGLQAVLEDAQHTPLGLGVAPGPKQLVHALNTEPAAGPVRLKDGRPLIEVLDAGTWAAFTQRHLLHHVESDVVTMREWWSQDKEAEQQRVRLEAMFGELRQWPLAARRMATERNAYAAAMRAALPLLAARPDWIGRHKWDSLLCPPTFPADTFAVPPMESWYKPLFPAGTYFEWPKKLRESDGQLLIRGPALQQMRDALPHYTQLAEAVVDDRLGSKATAADLRREFGPMVDFDLNLMIRVAEASKDDPAEYKRRYRRIGALNPERLEILAKYLADRGEKKEAAATYEEFAAHTRDRVTVCNSMYWVINYYEDQGNQKRALEIAQQAAEVYCAEGLVNLADLYERRRQWKDAEEYYRRYAERYDHDRVLLGFYLRHEQLVGHKFDEARHRELLARFFPKGLEKVGSDPAEPPPDGVILVGHSEEATKATLRAGDVIVALNGYRVRTYDQYRVVRTLSMDPELKLTLWRGKALHITARPPNRWFEVEVKSHHGAEENEKLFL